MELGFKLTHLVNKAHAERLYSFHFCGLCLLTLLLFCSPGTTGITYISGCEYLPLLIHPIVPFTSLFICYHGMGGGGRGHSVM